MTTTMATAADLDLDLYRLDIAECEAHWESALRERLGPMTVRVAPDHCDRGTVEGRQVGDLLITDWQCPSMEGMQSRSSVRGVERDAVVIFVGYDGQEMLSFGGQDAMLGAGTVVAVGQAGGRFTIPDHAAKRTLLMPRAALESVGGRSAIPTCLMLGQDRPMVRLFRSFLEQVWRELPVMNAAEIEATRGSLLELAAGMIRSNDAALSDRATLPALRARLDDWISHNLTRGPIRIEDIAAAHNVSPRTIHRAFALTSDNMTSAVRARRMGAVRDDIVQTNLTIAAVAHRWGYYDSSHLSREFRRYYGKSPADYRDAFGC